MERSLSLRVKTPPIRYQHSVDPIDSRRERNLSKNITRIHKNLKNKKREFIEHMKKSEARKKRIIQDAIFSRLNNMVILINLTLEIKF